MHFVCGLVIFWVKTFLFPIYKTTSTMLKWNCLEILFALKCLYNLFPNCWANKCLEFNEKMLITRESIPFFFPFHYTIKNVENNAKAKNVLMNMSGWLSPIQSPRNFHCFNAKQFFNYREKSLSIVNENSSYMSTNNWKMWILGWY